MGARQKVEKVLFVGADHLGAVPKKLYAEGAKEIIHWKGRNHSTQNREIPKNVDLIILNLNYISHGLMNRVKKQAKSRGIPIIFRKTVFFSQAS
ncbi:MAG TPA: dihydroorotate dehydrogenase [Syntrophomonas sp.]|jgi:hypothetical protein|nr:dihydroorotate dehydrogenase [Syntrophomonas sp.]